MNYNSEDVVIIGAGASGLICANLCAQSGKNVFIFDCAEKLGKKLLATGNGRCNLSNIFASPEKYNNPTFVKKIFNKFSPKDTLDYFESLGLVFYSDDEGRVYPSSNMASTVIGVLTKNLFNCKNVHLCLQNKVEDLSQFGQASVVVCVGGNSSALLKSIGVDLVPFLPALVGLKCQKHYIRGLSGLRAKAKITFDGRSEIGEVQFKDDGISGIAVMNTSVFMSRNPGAKKEIVINFAPNVNNLVEFLFKRKVMLAKSKSKDFLLGFFAEPLAKIFLQDANMFDDTPVANVCDEKIINLAKIISEYKIVSNNFYNNPQIYAGGVSVKSVDDNLKINGKNIYVCGEALDIDGECGGYNLQWAFSCGAVVANALINSNK